jgi:hypothetical protein
MKNYTLYKISLWSLLKVGFLVGWVASFLPVALFFLMFFKIVSALAAWLSGLVYQIRLPLPGNFGFDLNLVELLKLQGVVDQLQTWGAVGFIPTILIVLLVTSLFALFWGFVAAAGGLVFNLISKAIGGIQLTLSDQDKQPSPPAAVLDPVIPD